ncbi:oxygen-independent coproporphyrinogen III oxidase [Solirhodobacter olei]|uniref:oxygen-independent coproporphyrinogen III oxidase n=1 Tax=Solirhodobacter olei TaxID=2493082 RepID=UPI000FDB18AE|nr:oxygen-independent coproporphyrinogen III oxidase [Solirhodobacter olei]
MNTEPQLVQFGLFDARVPRYTSYPTAPHFAGNVDAALYGEWISAIPAGSRISLYMHVPFCRRLCWFCACRTQGTASDDPVIAYAQTLKAEIALLKDRLAPGVTLSRLHWGGGTPTLMPAALIEEIAGATLEAIPLAPAGEFSVEIDPGEIDAPRLDALRAAGMNRASVGVQDFDPEIQKTIGREQSYDLTRDVIDEIRARGVTSLNADILYGLPHQTPERLADSVQKLLSLSPDRVALYGYAHVPWIARRQVMIPSDTLPRPEERLALFETARKLFLWDGYREIGIDHFARPEDGLAIAHATGRLRRNFQGYTDDTAEVLVALGASAIARFPQGYAQNAPRTSDHVKAIREGRFSTARGHAFTAEDRIRGRIIEALMCDFRVSSAEIIRDYGATPEALAAMYDRALAAFPGMLEITPDGLAIPQRARPLTRMIARSFDAYDLSKAGHSSAI